MATATTNVFQKFRKLTKRQEGDGHEIQVEVREDEEQSIKLQEIIDLLVAAGYFRARIKGLSSFDKVVGGMTWCIESCNIEVDVDLLFQENSTIGQKIALTEKIVAVLPKMQCPFRIEPHQIQGLDFIHIFPVIQWLVKRSMEFRQEMSNFVESYAINQFNKHFQVENKQAQATKKVLENINTVNNLYRPYRHYKRKTAPPEDLQSRIQVTLLEYGQRGDLKNVVADASPEDIMKENETEELHIEQLLSNMTLSKDLEYSTLNEEDTKAVLDHYASLHNEMDDGGLKAREAQKLLALEQHKKTLLDKILQVTDTESELETKIEEQTNTLKTLQQKQKEAQATLLQLEQTLQQKPENVKEVEELVIINDTLRLQEISFREHCKQELTKLQNLIETTKKAKTPVENLASNNKELEEELEKLKVLRLHLAKKNRSVAVLHRQLDEVPSRAELAQYQRRFLELYNQVAAKHKETKQYFTLYNTLEDTRLYIKKELSILNSISDNYPQAILSNIGKEEFLKQLEGIAEGVRQSKTKVERKYMDEKAQKDRLSQGLHSLVEQQRRYVAAVRQLSIECKKHESLASLSATKS